MADYSRYKTETLIKMREKAYDKYYELTIKPSGNWGDGMRLSKLPQHKKWERAKERLDAIDAYFRPSSEFREIIDEIANEHNLNNDWLNDGVKGFIMPTMKQEQYKQYSNLVVYNIDAKGLLAMKLTSARVASKDFDDCLFLMKYLNIREERELFEIVEKYANPNQLTPRSNFFIQEVFIKYKERERNITNNLEDDYDDFDY